MEQPTIGRGPVSQERERRGANVEFRSVAADVKITARPPPRTCSFGMVPFSSNPTFECAAQDPHVGILPSLGENASLGGRSW